MGARGVVVGGGRRVGRRARAGGAGPAWVPPSATAALVPRPPRSLPTTAPPPSLFTNPSSNPQPPFHQPPRPQAIPPAVAAAAPAPPAPIAECATGAGAWALAVAAGEAKASLPVATAVLPMGVLAGVCIGFGASLALAVGGAVPALAASNPGLQRFLFGEGWREGGGWRVGGKGGKEGV